MQLFGNIYHIKRKLQYIVYMKKIIYIFAAAAGCAALLPSCAQKLDYYDSVSELRSNIYLYEEDGLSCKIYVSQKESPYNSDGIKGEMNSLIEISLTLDRTPNAAEITVNGVGGEMSYLSVSKSFTLSFSGEDFGTDNVSVCLTADGEEKQFEAQSVLYDGVIDARTALQCVTEYAGTLFENLTVNKQFKAEIYVRLLYDAGCFYYVGVCDRNGNTNAYLVDGETGRIIAERTVQN